MWWVPWRYKISWSVLLYSIRKLAFLLNFWLWLLGVPNEKQTNQSFLTNSDVNKVVLPMLSIKNMNRKNKKASCFVDDPLFFACSYWWIFVMAAFLRLFPFFARFNCCWTGILFKFVWYVTVTGPGWLLRLRAWLATLISCRASFATLIDCMAWLAIYSGWLQGQLI